MLTFVVATLLLIITPGPGGDVGGRFRRDLWLSALGSRLSVSGRPPGLMAGLLLQPINPKAYVVNTTLFSGFVLGPDAYWVEVAVKLLVLNVIWIPIHPGWLAAGVWLEHFDLPERTHRAINIAMAAAMLAVVGLAALSARV